MEIPIFWRFEKYRGWGPRPFLPPITNDLSPHRYVHNFYLHIRNITKQRTNTHKTQHDHQVQRTHPRAHAHPRKPKRAKCRGKIVYENIHFQTLFSIRLLSNILLDHYLIGYCLLDHCLVVALVTSPISWDRTGARLPHTRSLYSSPRYNLTNP